MIKKENKNTSIKSRQLKNMPLDVNFTCINKAIVDKAVTMRIDMYLHLFSVKCSKSISFICRQY